MYWSGSVDLSTDLLIVPKLPKVTVGTDVAAIVPPKFCPLGNGPGKNRTVGETPGNLGL